jgi:hypothetical protein
MNTGLNAAPLPPSDTFVKKRKQPGMFRLLLLRQNSVQVGETVCTNQSAKN